MLSLSTNYTPPTTYTSTYTRSTICTAGRPQPFARAMLTTTTPHLEPRRPKERSLLRPVDRDVTLISCKPRAGLRRSPQAPACSRAACPCPCPCPCSSGRVSRGRKCPDARVSCMATAIAGYLSMRARICSGGSYCSSSQLEKRGERVAVPKASQMGQFRDCVTV
jgi:hypothetical protein